MKNISDKICRENQNTLFVFQLIFFFANRAAFFEINVGKYCRVGQAKDDNMAHAHCTLDTYGYKYTQSVCVILIAFPLLYWFQESTSVLRYTLPLLLIVSLKIYS
jgi:hypothetical protein